MRKKMIEVAIPLDAINRESAREKSIRHGHPSTLHLWWARRPLAACRAVIFTSLVDDPESDPANRDSNGELIEERVKTRRHELFSLLEDLVKWENSTSDAVLNRAKAELAAAVASEKVYDSKTLRVDEMVAGEPVQAFVSRSASPSAVASFLRQHAPPIYDPFAGGGSIPLEAQRLGLVAYASDLNPVPVLINKSLIEIPTAFEDLPPVNPEAGLGSAPERRSKEKQKTLQGRSWRASQGLANDIRFYGKWIRDEAEKKVGHLYPKVRISQQATACRPDLEPYVGQELTVIAWLWARTVASPNPAAMGEHVPLVKSFWISHKKGNEAWIEPIVHECGSKYEFRIRTGKPLPEKEAVAGTISRNGATCLLTGQPISLDYIRSEGRAGRISQRLLAVVAEGKKGRIFLSPDLVSAAALEVPLPSDVPRTPIPAEALGFRVHAYGLDEHWKLFTPRQLAAIDAFRGVLQQAHDEVLSRCQSLGVKHGDRYAVAVTTYLAFGISKAIDLASTLCRWQPNAQHLKLAPTFARHSLSMTWDFAEGNPFSESSGNFQRQFDLIAEAVEWLPASGLSCVEQLNAMEAPQSVGAPVAFCTDPPYYDNVPYADLSDFFYVWLRQMLAAHYPELLRTVLVPKSEELVAEPARHGGKASAKAFFEKGMAKVFQAMAENMTPHVPLTVFYAFKQAESDDAADDEDTDNDDPQVASTGWETMMEALINAGLQVVGTWPVRTERPGRLRETGSNALASSIVLVCRTRGASAPLTSRREFVAALKRELPQSLRGLQSGNIAPVDLAQAAIGPGMAVYSRYSKVLESSGERLTVRTALALINQVLDEVLAEQEGDYDADTRWSLTWFEQFAHDDGPFGDANTLATAMSIGINGLVETGIVQAKAGKVRLLKRTELMNGRPETWDPATDTDIVHWEVCQYLIHALDTKGEAGTAALLRRINARYPGAAETARELAYRLYTICERKKWAQEAMAYNSLIVAWPEIVKLAQSSDGSGGDAQTTMF